MTAPSKTPSFEGGPPQGTPEMVPKPMEAHETSSKKSKKRQAIAVAALGHSKSIKRQRTPLKVCNARHMPIRVRGVVWGGCVGVWGRGAGAVVAHDYWGSSYEILGLFLQNTGVLLTTYWGSSYKILGFFLHNTGVIFIFFCKKWIFEKYFLELGRTGGGL